MFRTVRFVTLFVNNQVQQSPKHAYCVVAQEGDTAVAFTVNPSPELSSDVVMIEVRSLIQERQMAQLAIWTWLVRWLWQPRTVPPRHRLSSFASSSLKNLCASTIM